MFFPKKLEKESSTTFPLHPPSPVHSGLPLSLRRVWLRPTRGERLWPENCGNPVDGMRGQRIKDDMPKEPVRRRSSGADAPVKPRPVRTTLAESEALAARVQESLASLQATGARHEEALAAWQGAPPRAA